jgi:hypothetical protein
MNDTFRLMYRVLTTEEKELMHNMKLAAQELETKMSEILELKGSSQELNQAHMKLQEAVMWATKALA